MRKLSERFALVPLVAAAAYLVALLSVASVLPAPPEEPPASLLPDWWLWAAALGGLLVAHIFVVLPVRALARQVSSRALWLVLSCTPAVAGTIAVAVGLAGPGYPWYSGWPLGFGAALAGVPLAMSTGLSTRRARRQREDMLHAA